MIDKRAKISFDSIGLIPLIDKYFPTPAWVIKYRKSRTGSNCCTMVQIRPLRKVVTFYSALFDLSLEHVKHTIIHEYCHYFLSSQGKPSGHTPEFYKILHILEEDENCVYSQNRVGINNLAERIVK